MRCDEAMHLLARIPPATGPEADAAKAHVVTCRACLVRLDQLRRAVLSPLPVELACAECRERLPELRELLASTSDPRAASMAEGLAATLAHVRHCPYCIEELAALDAVMAAWAAGTLPALNAEPTLDLSFLEGQVERLPEAVELESPPEAAPDAVGIAEPGLWLVNVGRAARDLAGEVRTLFTDIVIDLGARGAAFGVMPGPLAPALVPARATRDAGPTALPQTLVVPDPPADLTIRLTVGPMVDQRAVVDLMLREDGDRRPLGDTRVVLYDADERLLASVMTAGDGRAQFRDLGQGRYLFEIRRQGRRWRLPLRVTAEGEASAD